MAVPDLMQQNVCWVKEKHYASTSDRKHESGWSVMGAGVCITGWRSKVRESLILLLLLLSGTLINNALMLVDSERE